MRRYRYLLFIAGLVLAGFAPAFAQSDYPGVARLSYIGGDVAVQRGNSQNNVAAAINAPVLAGDAISTGSGRSEVQFDGTSMLRIDRNTQVRFARLDPGNSIAQLAQGTVNLDLLHGADGTQQIDTPSVSLRGNTSGRYRVTVTGSGDTLVTVRSGSADILFPQDRLALMPGETLLVQGPASNPSYRYIDAVAYDAFDSFNQDRDGMWGARLGNDDYAYDTIDGDDLDSYGHWVWYPSYGRVWSPYVATGWAPYRYGQWAWEPGFGWDWVSSDPWGWAPYHYGRWFYAANYGWCWYPPAPNSIWAPALVAFFSFGNPGFNSIGFGNIGWVPLAPWETYHPWWGHRGDRETVINVTTINVYNYYSNARHGGFTGVDARSWQHGDFHHNVAINEPEIRNARAFAGTLPITPTANNLRFSNHALPQSLVAHHFNTNEHFAGNTTNTRFTRNATNQHFAENAVNQHFPSSTTNYVHTTTLQHVNTPLSHPVNAWERFNQNRGANYHDNGTLSSGNSNATGATGSNITNANTGVRYRRVETNSSSTYHGTATTTNTYHPPSNPNAYHPPADTYHPPVNTYHPPVNTYQYSRPSGNANPNPNPNPNYSHPHESTGGNNGVSSNNASGTNNEGSGGDHGNHGHDPHTNATPSPR